MTDTTAPSRFDARTIYDEALEKSEDALSSVVFQALGAASVCWDDDRVFLSEEAAQIGESLVTFLREHGIFDDA